MRLCCDGPIIQLTSNTSKKLSSLQKVQEAFVNHHYVIDFFPKPHGNHIIEMLHPDNSKPTEMGKIIISVSMNQPQSCLFFGRGGREREGGDAMFGSYPTNLVPLGPSCSTGLTRLSPSLRAGSFLGRCSLLCPQDSETHTHPHAYTKQTLAKSVKVHTTEL